MNARTNSNRILIGICCDTFEQAVNAFRKWVNFLEENEPEYLEEYDEHTLSVKFGEVFLYIFFDERLSPFFKFADTVLYLDEFFFLEEVVTPLKNKEVMRI